MRRLKEMPKEHVTNLVLKPTTESVYMNLDTGVYFLDFSNIDTYAGEEADYYFTVGNRIICPFKFFRALSTVSNHCQYPGDGVSYINFYYNQQAATEDKTEYYFLIVTDDFVTIVENSLFEM